MGSTPDLALPTSPVRAVSIAGLEAATNAGKTPVRLGIARLYGEAHIVYAAFDGGSRRASETSACAWCVWTSDGRPLQWQAMAYSPARTNNDMEAPGLFHCLRWLRRHHPRSVAVVFGDSALIINMALVTNCCRAAHLRPWIAAIRSHGTGRPLIRLEHVRREHNGAADALCNWAIDQPPGGNLWVQRGTV